MIEINKRRIIVILIGRWINYYAFKSKDYS